MQKMTLGRLSGFMELLRRPSSRWSALWRSLRKTYSLYGFTPMDTPVIESSEVLLAKAGGETEKQIYRFQKGDSDLSLRFDLYGTSWQSMWPSTTMSCPSPSAGIRSARCIGASGPSGAGSVSSISGH